MNSPADKKRDEMPPVNTLEGLFWPANERLRNQERIEKIRKKLKEIRRLAKNAPVKKDKTKDNTKN